MATYLIDRHVPLRYRGEFDVGRIADRMPDELAVVGALEPASEGVVPAQIRVEGVVHGGDIAIPRNVTAGYDLPGKIQPGIVAFVVITKMLSLHVADRHRTHRCLPGFSAAAGVGCQDVTVPAFNVHSSSAPTVIVPMRKTPSLSLGRPRSGISHRWPNIPSVWWRGRRSHRNPETPCATLHTVNN